MLECTKKLCDSFLELGVPGFDLAVYQNGECLLRYIKGHSDLEREIPMNGSEKYNVYSCSKVITCVAAMQLVESGKIKLDDPVSKYLPAFETLYVRDKASKEVHPTEHPLTVEHLFTMTGGFGYDINSAVLTVARSNPNASTREVVNALAKEALFFEPGTHFRYSLCHDILAAVVEVASGMLFRDYLKKFLFDPLGMKDTGFHLPAELADRMTTMYDYTHGVSTSRPIECKNKYCLTDNYDSGGAGLFSCVDDYMKFATTLACGGTTKDGYTLLRPETIAMMEINRLCPAAVKDLNAGRGG